MNVTGDATRTISSTAVGVTPSRSSCQIRRWSGFCDSRFIPWLIAVRVVSLPATARRMKNGAISCGASMSSPTSLWTSADVRSSVGLRPALLGQLVHQRR